MSTTALPDLFTRHAFAREGILDSDAEGLEGFFDLASAQLDKFAAAEAEVAAKILADADLTEEARNRRAFDYLSTTRDRTLAKVDEEIERRRGDLSRAADRFAAAGRPAPDTSITAVTRAIAVSDALRQLESMEHPDRVRVVMSAAAAGDLVPVEACERSYKPLVPSDVLSRAREEYANAKSGDLSKMRDRLRLQVERAERVRAEAAGKMLLKINRFMTRTKAA